MKPYRLFHQIYIPLALLLLVICYLQSIAGIVQFDKDEDFVSDLRVKLPEYAIKEKSLTPVCNGLEGELMYDSLAYKVQLLDPLSDKSTKIITSERRGWECETDGVYSLARSLLYETMECRYYPKQNTLLITYYSNFDPFGLIYYPIILSMFLAVIYIVALILLSIFIHIASAIKKRR